MRHQTQRATPVAGATVIDTAAYWTVLALLGVHVLAGLYLVKSALGIDLFDGPSSLHPLFFG